MFHSISTQSENFFDALGIAPLSPLFQKIAYSKEHLLVAKEVKMVIELVAIPVLQLLPNMDDS